MSKRNGIILKGVGGNYVVDCDGREYLCKAGGRLRLLTLVPTVGDSVQIEIDADDSGYIVEICERRNSLARPAVANIDQLFVLATEAPPQTDTYLIDKVCALALWQGIRPVIVLNKCDLNTSDALYATYTAAGFDVLRVSAETGQGIEALRAMLADKVSAFTGNSGVGKSSVLNRIDARFELHVGEISSKIARGRNTTRHVELLRLEGGGYVADTPGFSAFDITRMEYIPKEQLAGLFAEIEDCFGHCRFSDCRHIGEPGCAVLDKIERVPALKSRHESYVKLYGELAQINEWEVRG